MDTALNREASLEGQKKHWSSVTPMGRLGRPDELNGLAVFLASDASAFVTGAEVLVDVSLYFISRCGDGSERFLLILCARVLVFRAVMRCIEYLMEC